MTSKTDKQRAEQLREQAKASDRRRIESEQRSDTDGFLSQWASGLGAQEKRLEADLVEAGGEAYFARDELHTLDGYPAPAKLIRTKFGLAWALEDVNGRFTGEFITAHPKRESTMEKKGYREVETFFRVPAKVKIVGTGTGLSGNAWVSIVPRDPDVKYDRGGSIEPLKTRQEVRAEIAAERRAR